MTTSSSIDWIQHGELISGQGDPNDVLNRPLRNILSGSGYAPDGTDFQGFVPLPSASAVTVQSGSFIIVTGSANNTTATTSYVTGSVFGLTGSVNAQNFVMNGTFTNVSGSTFRTTGSIGSITGSVFVTGSVTNITNGTLVGNVTNFTGSSSSGSFVNAQGTFNNGNVNSFSGSVSNSTIQLFSGSITDNAPIQNFSGSGYYKAVDPYDFGAAGTGLVNDSSSLGRAFTSASVANKAVHLSPGSYVVSGTVTFTHLQMEPGAIITPASGAIVYSSGALVAGNHPIFDLSQNGKVLFTNSPLPYIRTSWFKEITVTVPAPTQAPQSVSTTQDSTPFHTPYTASHAIEVGYTYVGYDGGETLMSPTASYTIQTGFENIVVAFSGSLTCRAIGVSLYWRDATMGGTFLKMTGGGNWNQAGVTQTQKWGFGDMTDATGAYGVGTTPSLDTPSYTAIANAHDADGTVLTAPTAAPMLSPIGALPANTSFYVAYSYVCQDGTETALSPIAGPVTTGASGGCIRFFRQTLPPPGATSVNVYLGTASNALTRQMNVPLHYLFIQINTYIVGASNTPGACQSTISPLQQAWTCVHDSGGGREIIVDTNQHIYVPLIFGQSNGNADGISVIGGKGAFSNNSSNTTVSYIGPNQQNLCCIVSSASATSFRHLSFYDPNQYISFGLGFCDPFGGNSFYQVWDGISIVAFGPSGIGLSVNNHSVGASHTASEQKFYNCYFAATTWACDVRGQQTANFRFHNLQTFGGFNNSTMVGGDVRLSNSNVAIEEHFAGAHGGYVYFITSENYAYYAGGGTQSLFLINCQTELDNGGPIYLYNSETDIVGSDITIINGGVLNNLGRSAYDIICGARSRIVGIHTVFGNNVLIDNALATFITHGKSILYQGGKLLKQTTRFALPVNQLQQYPQYYPPLVVYSGGIAFADNNGVRIEYRKIAGTGSLDPASLANGATQLVGTIAVTGSAVGDAVESVVHSASQGTYFYGVVTAPDVVTIYQSNNTGGSVDVASGTVTAIVTKKIQ